MKNKIAIGSLIVFMFAQNVSFAAVQTVTGGGSVGINADGIADGVSFTDQGTAENTLTVPASTNINTNINAAGIVTDVDLKGNIAFSGPSNISGTVGSAMLRLNDITITGANADFAQFDGDVFFDTATLNNGADMRFEGDVTATSFNITHNNSQVRFSTSNKILNANITTTAGNNTGIVDFRGNSTFTGNVGADGAALREVRLNQNNDLSLNGNIFTDLLRIMDDGTTTVNGDITLGTSINYEVNGTFILEDGSDITGAITNSSGVATGTLTLNGTSTISGQVGSIGVGALSVINAGATDETATFSSGVFADILNVTGTGDVALNGDFTGNLDYDANGTVTLADDSDITGTVTNSSGVAAGTLTFNGTSDISGQVGASGVGALSTINAGATGETVTFSNNVFATTTNVTGTGNVAFDVDLTGNLDYDANGTVTLADNSDITGTVTNSSGAAAGTLTFNGTSTISGQVGASGVGALSTINAGAAGKTTTFSSDVFASTLNVTGASGSAVVLNGDATSNVVFLSVGSANLVVADGKDVIGTITATTDGNGVLTFLGATSVSQNIGSSTHALSNIFFNGAATVDADIYSGNINLASGSSITLADNQIFSGFLFVNSGSTLDLGSKALAHGTAGVVNFASGSTLMTAIASNAVFGNILSTGNAVVDAASILDITVLGSITNGTTFKIIDGAGGASVNVPGTITDDNLTLSFTGSVDSGDLILTALRSVSNVSGLSSNALALFEILNTSTSQAVTELLASLDAITSEAAYKDALESLLNDVTGGNVAGSISQLNQMLNVLLNRLSSGTSSGDVSLSSGDLSLSQGIWAQGFGSYANQDTRQSIPGFDATTWGTLVGYDKKLNDNFLLGLASGFSSTDVDGDGISNTQTNIDSVPLVIYGQYDFDYMIADFGGSVTWHQYDSTRDIPFLFTHADADYDGQSYSAFLQLSKTFEQPIMDITPIAGLTYQHLSLEDYTETGAGAANLTVQDQDYDMLIGSIGLKLSKDILCKCGSTLTPSIIAKYNYDFIGDEIQTNASFANTTNSFTTTGFDPEQNSFTVGAQIQLATTHNWTITANYNLDTKEDYYSHNGSLTVRYGF